MLLRFGVMLRFWAAAVVVTLAHLRHGRARPRWTWTHQLIATCMKREFARLKPLPWSVQRRTWRAIALPAFAVRGARFERTSVAGMDADWITPHGTPAGDNPVILYLHGGAYLFGSIDEYRDFATRLACASGARALVVDYRLAPEHPFPAAHDDAVSAYRALLESGIDARRIVVAGDSAGGGLAASVLVTLRERGLPLPAGGVLVSPWVDLAARGGTLVSNEKYDFFSPDLVAYWSREIVAGADATDPRASPGRADLRGLPPLLVEVGGAEMILDQVVAFAERARVAGVDARLRVWEDCFHDWPLFAAVLGDGRRAVDEMGAFIREITGAARASSKPGQASESPVMR
jgi:monoterpene epsilon-lactone hydrolase